MKHIANAIPIFTNRPHLLLINNRNSSEAKLQLNLMRASKYITFKTYNIYNDIQINVDRNKVMTKAM